MKGKFGLDTKMNAIAAENLFISEITLAELKFGVENSEHPIIKPSGPAPLPDGSTVIANCASVGCICESKNRACVKPVPSSTTLIY